LQELARALTVRKIDELIERSVTLSRDELKSFNSAGHSAKFKAAALDSSRRLDWHEREARECRLIGRHKVESFHIDRLLAGRQSPEFLERWKTLHEGADWQPSAITTSAPDDKR